VAMTELWEKRPQPRGGAAGVASCRHLGTKFVLVPANLGIASARLRTGILWWYQMRGRQTKFFRKYIMFA
jgi:hypothetical protein